MALEDLQEKLMAPETVNDPISDAELEQVMDLIAKFSHVSANFNN